MTKKVWILSVLSLAIIASLSALNLSAQTSSSGDWTASLVEDNSRLNLNFDRRSEKSGKHQMGQTYDFAELGLTREQVLGSGAVRFSLVREAGTIDCEGSFQNGKGSGTFRFTGSQAFVAAMKSRGFDFEKESSTEEGRFEDRLFTATALNITTALADDLNSAGFGKLGVSDLAKAAIFKIDSKFMREMKASGFLNLGMEDLVKARIFKIDAHFVTEVARMGFDKEPFEGLVKMQIFKVTPAFIAEVRNEGLTDLTVEQLVRLQIFKIDSDFIRKAKADGVPLQVERLVQRRLGVAQKKAI
ncbi:MAG TPA: hypothetical protein VMS31_18865 [Pyrinomonadaceae bacterium]|nr:hypothetical protein [Pyrinomonadaceae bacterium]